MAVALGRETLASSKQPDITSRSWNPSEADLARVQGSFAGDVGASPSNRQIERRPGDDPFVDPSLRHSQPAANRAPTGRQPGTNRPPTGRQPGANKRWTSSPCYR